MVKVVQRSTRFFLFSMGCLSILLVALISPSAHAATTIWYVDADGEAGEPDGRSWATAYVSIQETIDAASAGASETDPAEVWVAEGTYTGVGGIPEADGDSMGECVVVMAEHVHLYGGFEGNEKNREARNWEDNIARIDGEESRRGVYGADHATLDGFLVVNGLSAGVGEGLSGGGMLNLDVSPTVSNCTFEDNSTGGEGKGGGMYNALGKPKIHDCRFLSNDTWEHQTNSASARAIGGGLCNSRADATVTNCVFTSNWSAAGGGLANLECSSQVSGCMFEANRVSMVYDGNWHLGGGGGVYNSWGSPVVDDCTFSNNLANDGAGVYNSGGTPTIARCQFTENRGQRQAVDGGRSYTQYSRSSGGGICNVASVARVTHCVFRANTADSGGGILNGDCTPWADRALRVENCVFESNRATDRGGAAAEHNTISTWVNCTFHGNVSESFGTGGAIDASDGELLITNCILWDNGSANVEAEETETVTFSCIDGGHPGEGNIEAYPRFRDPLQADFRLHPMSPCRDTATADSAPDTDLLGVARPVGSGVDMGAYEMNEPDSDGDGLSDGFEEDESETDPEDPDSDGDGIGDGEEWFAFGVWYVDAGTEAAAPTGESWAEAFGDIQSAVDAAFVRGGGDVWVAEGSYTGTDENVVIMRKNVHLYGGFVGNETERTERDWQQHPTQVDGEDERRCVLGASDVVLDGFEVLRGNEYFGAGLNCQSTARVQVRNCLFQGNTSGKGGGINALASSLDIADCQFSANRSSSTGAGVCAIGSDLQIASCDFRANEAGPIPVEQLASVTPPEPRGGALYSEYSSLTLTDSVIEENEAGAGGGVYASGSSMNVSQCEILTNHAEEGGGLRVGGGTVSVTDCIIAQNTATGGGGLYVSEGVFSAVNCLLSGNSANLGGAIHAYMPYGGAPTFTNCTISGNMDSNGQPGVGLLSSYGVPLVANSILWDNGDSISGDATVTFSCVEGGYEGEGNIDVDPRFVNPGTDDFHLQYGSPCRDAGLADGAPTTDLDGTDRPQGPGIDMGTYEFYLGSPHTADWHDGMDYTIDLTELLRVLQLYKAAGYHCAAAADGSEDGFMPYADDSLHACEPHALDYLTTDWRIGFHELLRLIQIYNASGYYPCVEGEDLYCIAPRPGETE